MSLSPTVIPAGCPACGADVRFDRERLRYVCADGCGYSRATLHPEPADLVKRNGHAPPTTEPVELMLTPEEMSGFVARPDATSRPEAGPTLPAEIGWFAPTPPGYLTYRDLAERWGLSENGTRNLLAKTGTPLRRVPVPGTRHQRVFVAAADADKINPDKIPGLRRRALRPEPFRFPTETPIPETASASAPVGEPSEPEPPIETSAPTPVATVAAETIQVRLRSTGGLVTLTVQTPWTRLDPGDRAFVYTLIDRLNVYREADRA